MAANKIFRTGPIALTTTLTTNLLNLAITSLAGPVGVTLNQPVGALKGLHFVNKDTVPRTISLWLGATGANAAGTEVFNGYSVPANGVYDWSPPGGSMPMGSADFLVGGASANTTITMEAQVEVGF